jgi:hypothetical protein
MNGVQYGGQKLSTKRVYFASDGYKLTAGEPLCYQITATVPSVTAPVVGAGSNANSTAKSDQRGLTVERAASANLLCFAGIVPDHEAGRNTSGWMDLWVPQGKDVVPALCDGATDITVGVTNLKVAACSTTTPGYLTADTSHGIVDSSVGLCMETYTDTPIVKKLVMFY